MTIAAYRQVLGVPSNYSEFRQGSDGRFDAVRSTMLGLRVEILQGYTLS